MIAIVEVRNVSPSSPSSEFDVSRAMEERIRSASVSIGAAERNSAVAEANTGAFIKFSVAEFGLVSL